MNYDLEAARLKKDWAENPRWKGIQRGYTAEDVVRLRGSVHIEHTLARRGAEKLWKLLHDEPFVNTLGALTGNQALQQVKAASGHLPVGLAGRSRRQHRRRDVSDQSLYPVNSVPLVMTHQHSLMRADQIQHMKAMATSTISRRSPTMQSRIRWRSERVRADEGDDRGAAGVHFEDQLAAVKECGHMGGKVLYPRGRSRSPSPHGSPQTAWAPTIVLARTDAEAADLVTSDVDDNDKPFLTGERTIEGFFRTRAGLDQAVSRGLAYAAYADLIWCETGKPDLDFAKAFAEAIQAKYPGKMLAYNCSPSFNWKKNLDDATSRGSSASWEPWVTSSVHHACGLHSSLLDINRPRLRAQQHERVRRAPASRIRRGGEGLHRGAAPARSGNRLFRRGHDDRAGKPGVDDRAVALDGGRAVLRREEGEHGKRAANA
jgi:isocitrate lyase